LLAFRNLKKSKTGGFGDTHNSFKVAQSPFLIASPKVRVKRFVARRCRTA
jgi:hypothetical protein